jgi:hypothetical protein
MKYWYLYFIFVIIGCHPSMDERNKSNDSTRIELSTSEEPNFEAEVEKFSFVNEDSTRKYLQGAWAEDSDSNILFSISGDSLYYFEDPNPIFIDIHTDTLVLFVDESLVVKNRIIKIGKDSLVMLDNGRLMRLYRRSWEPLRY